MKEGGGGEWMGRQGVLFCEGGQKPTETNVVADEVSYTPPPHPILSHNRLCYPKWQYPPPPYPTLLDNVRCWREPYYIRERRRHKSQELWRQ